MHDTMGPGCPKRSCGNRALVEEADITLVIPSPATEEWIQVAVCLVLSENQVLLQRRRGGSFRELAGGWELPGGRVEPGESIVDAAVRETREETGVAVRAVSPSVDVSPISRRLALPQGGALPIVLNLVWAEPATRRLGGVWVALSEVPWAEINPGDRELLGMGLSRQIPGYCLSVSGRMLEWTPLATGQVQLGWSGGQMHHLSTFEAAEEMARSLVESELAGGKTVQAIDDRHPLQSWIERQRLSS